MLFFNSRIRGSVLLKKKRINDYVEITRTKEIKEAFNKLYKLDNRKAMDRSYWRKAFFEDVCSNKVNICTEVQIENPFEDHLLTFHEPKKAIKRLFYLFFSKRCETSLSGLVMFDAVITEMANSFKFILQDKLDKNRYIEKKELNKRQGTRNQKNGNAKGNAWFGKKKSFFTKVKFV